MTIRRVPVLSAPSNQPEYGSQPVAGCYAMKPPMKLLKPWKLPPRKKYIFKNASIVDTANACIIPNQTVILSDGLIDSITTSSSTSDNISYDEDTVAVDLQGKYLCPGLIDCHVHMLATQEFIGFPAGGHEKDHAISLLRQSFLCSQMLSRGFTTIRDTGGATLALKEAIADDVFPGPRIFFSKQSLSQTGGHGDSRSQHDPDDSCGCAHGSLMCQVVDGVPDITRATREQLRQGADFIKILTGGGVASPTDKLESTQFTAAEVRVIAEVAESFGTYVTAHAYTPKAIRHAIDNGVMGIEHGNLLDKDTAEYMAKKGAYLTPTLVTYDAMGSSKYAGFLPPENQAKNQKVLAVGLESLKMAAEAGVTICHGSDLIGALHEEQSREFAIRARVLDSKTVLQSATVNPARMLRQEGFLGQLKEGFAADVLVLNENPLEDVTILSEPEKHVLAVVKDGRVQTSRWKKLCVDTVEVQSYIE